MKKMIISNYFFVLVIIIIPITLNAQKITKPELVLSRSHNYAIMINDSIFTGSRERIISFYGIEDKTEQPEDTLFVKMENVPARLSTKNKHLSVIWQKNKKTQNWELHTKYWEKVK